MIKDLLGKLLAKKEAIQNQYSEVKELKQAQPSEGEIIVTKENNYYKVEITDSVSFSTYEAKRKSSEEFSILDKICPAVSLDSNGINKGTYYVIETEKCLYNILIKGRETIIHESERKDINENENQIMRKNFGGEDQAFGDYYVQDRCLSFKSNNNDYYFSCLRHRVDGDTYYHKFYSKVPSMGFGNLQMTDQEAYDEIKDVLGRLEEIDGIHSILDFDLLNAQVIEDLKDKVGISL